jgi:hypothetical protein
MAMRMMTTMTMEKKKTNKKTKKTVMITTNQEINRLHC